ncbi:hypothetical protein, partial [Aeromonas dhakensis]|uniref:hypothetical protein n=1 Tax=Aeromonas dhakensis TaxID=196024 RepID=UPI0039A30376
ALGGQSICQRRLNSLLLHHQIRPHKAKKPGLSHSWLLCFLRAYPCSIPVNMTRLHDIPLPMSFK